jgi:hypothetical protein
VGRDKKSGRTSTAGAHDGFGFLITRGPLVVNRGVGLVKIKCRSHRVVGGQEKPVSSVLEPTFVCCWCLQSFHERCATEMGRQFASGGIGLLPSAVEPQLCHIKLCEEAIPIYFWGSPAWKANTSRKCGNFGKFHRKQDFFRSVRAPCQGARGPAL